MSQPTAITLENDVLALRIDPANGTIKSLYNKAANIELVTCTPDAPAWRLETESGWTSAFERFASETLRHGVRLVWRTAEGIGVEAQIELLPGSPQIDFRVRVLNPTSVALEKIGYPILGGIGALSDTEDSYLLHAQGTGFLFRNPHTLFETPNEANASPKSRQGLRYSPYPEGFSGSSTQLMAYYADDIGGFDFTAQDASGALKWLNFYKTESGALECSFMHQSPSVEPSADFDVPYSIRIGVLVEGNWYEAAERYKAWALQQSWARKGTNWSRAGQRVIDDAGIATFGINASHDRAAWLDYFHQIAGTPVFHVLGVNWAKNGGDYHNHLPGGHGDWFPARFNAANLDAIRRNGDYWAPFEFDLLLAPDRDESEQVQAALITMPDEKYSFDRYAFPFVCPAAGYLKELHRWRDETLVREFHPDAIYYDISVNNVLMACRNPNHGHPVGGGQWIVDAYSDLLADTKQAMDAAAGEYVAQGTEMINEVFIPVVDYYQARAEGSPLSSFEGDFFRDWIKAGSAEKVPLFTYIYHEYAPVRMDGWSKLSVEVGDLFYWVASRVALWGGLFEINGEFSPLESLDGLEDRSEEHYYQFEDRSYAVDPAKAAFVGEVAAARVSFAKDYLVYGTMQRPLPLDVPAVTLDYFLYNAPRALPHYGEHGRKTVPSVVHATWRSPQGKLGFMFVNLTGATMTLPLTIDRARYGLAADQPLALARVTSSERTSLGAETDFKVDLPARRVVLIEVESV